jgi:hypothetical protein
MRITIKTFILEVPSYRKPESQIQILVLLNNQRNICPRACGSRDSGNSDASRPATETMNALANNGGAS